MFELAENLCPPVAEPDTMARIVKVESSGNPFAIGVVAGRLQRQPRSLEEAVLTADSLERAGYNYSVGLSQVNRVHFKRLGWSGDIAKGFDACRNLHAGADVYARCKQGAERKLRAADATSVLRAALSCYYSGDFVTGERSGYVDKVLATSTATPGATPAPLRSFRSMFD
jgi:type IV secretion system protein VirB1